MLSIGSIKKQLIYHLSVLFAVGVLSCSKSDQPAPTSVTLLTYQNNNADTDNWIYVTDEDGKILDTKQFANGQKVILESTNKLPTQKINVTIFSYKILPTGGESFSFNTYLAVAVNDSWLSGTDKAFIYPKSSVIKSSSLQITNYTNATGSVVDYSVSTYKGGISYSGSQTSNTLSLTFDPSDAPTFYVRAFKNNQPVFKEFANPSNINSFTANFTTEFQSTGHTLDIPTYAGAHHYQGYISAFRKNENNITYGGGADPSFSGGYIQGLKIYSPAPYKLGYNDGFDFYYTEILTYFNSANMIYSKFGQPPTTIPIINYSSTVTDKSLFKFAFTVSDSYEYRLSTWQFITPTYPQGTYWYVYSPMEGKHNIANIPTEITGKYPGIAVGSLKYTNTTFYRTYDGFKYDDFIGGRMRPNSGKKLYSREYQSVVLSN